MALHHQSSKTILIFTLLNVIFLINIVDGIQNDRTRTNVYFTYSNYCPDSCRCKQSKDNLQDDRNSYYHNMYVRHWLERIYGDGDSQTRSLIKRNVAAAGQGREMMCLGLQNMPVSLPSDLVKLQIYGGKQGIRRLREGSLYQDAPYDGMDNRLPVQYFQIKSLDSNSFNRATHLTDLVITGNRIKLLSNGLAPLQKLKNLSLRKNRIKILEEHTFDFNFDLEKIDLTNNHIMKIPKRVFNRLKRLVELRLGENKIGIRGLHRDTFASLNQLKILDLSDNLLKSIHPDIFKHNRLLQELDLSHNKLTTIDMMWFRSLSQLKKLNLQGNRFGTIPWNAFKPLRLLTDLNLRGNNITYVNRNVFLPMPKLERLDMSQNNLRYIASYTFADLYKLEDLHLQENDIEHISNNSFANLKLLATLNLSKNRLKDISNKTYEPLRKLRKLDLSHNLIKTLRAQALFGLHDLQQLMLQHNDISHIDDSALSVSWLRHYSKITWLSLQHNKIPYIGQHVFRGAPHVKYLDIGHNQITGIHDQAFKSMLALNILKLNWNRIAELSDFVFKTLKGVQLLDLSWNKLLYVPSAIFDGLHRAEEINLASNRLMSIPEKVFNATPRLVHVDLSGNNLDRLAMRMFEHNKYLRRVNLANSSINALDVAINLGYKLDHLNIAENHIESLGPAIITWLARNATFKLAGNPWTCDCRLRWMTDAIQTGFVFVPDKYGVTCKRPAKNIGRKIYRMMRSDFPCEGRKLLPPSDVVYRAEKSNPSTDSKLFCPSMDSGIRRRLPRPILEEWHATVFDRYKRPVCAGVRLADDFLLTHASCWLNRSISAMDILDGKVLVKTGGERDVKTSYSFRVKQVYLYPKMAVSPRSEYRSLALVKIQALRPGYKSQYYPCINNPVNVKPKSRLTYFLTAKLAGVRPATRVKLRTMTVRGTRHGPCDGVHYACTKSFVRRMPKTKYLTESSPLYARDDLGLVGIRSMLQSPHVQTFLGVADIVPWMDQIMNKRD